MSNGKGRKGPTGLKGKRINGTTASSVQCPVPVRESDSVLVVPLRGDITDKIGTIDTINTISTISTIDTIDVIDSIDAFWAF